MQIGNKDAKRILLDLTPGQRIDMPTVYPAIRTAIDALDKQIEKAPERINGSLAVKFSYWKCPTCGEDVFDTDRYCGGCGQRLGPFRHE